MGNPKDRFEQVLTQQSHDNTLDLHNQFNTLLTQSPPEILSKYLNLWNKTVFQTLENISIHDYLAYCTSKFDDHVTGKVLGALSQHSEYFDILDLQSKLEDPACSDVRGELLYVLAHMQYRNTRDSFEELQEIAAMLGTAIEILTEKKGKLTPQHDAKHIDLKSFQDSKTVSNTLMSANYLYAKVNELLINPFDMDAQETQDSLLKAIIGYNNAIFEAGYTNFNKDLFQQKCYQAIAQLHVYMGKREQAHGILMRVQEDLRKIGMQEGYLSEYLFDKRDLDETVLESLAATESHGFTPEALDFSDSLLEMENHEFFHIYTINKLRTAYALIHLTPGNDQHNDEIVVLLQEVREFLDEQGALDNPESIRHDEVKLYYLVLGAYYMLCTDQYLLGKSKMDQIPEDDTCDIYLEVVQVLSYYEIKTAHMNAQKEKTGQPGKVIQLHAPGNTH